MSIVNKIPNHIPLQMSYGFIYMWNLKKRDTDELIYKTEIYSEIENQLMVTKGAKIGGTN